MGNPRETGKAGTIFGFLRGLCLAAGLFGCDAAPTSPQSDPADAAADSIAYLALGDSYTIGEGVPVADRWPMQLAAKARAAGIRLSDPEIIARTGWTTGELSAAMDAANPKGPYGLVTLLIGVNNQYRGLALEEYLAGFDSLLLRAIELAGGKPDRVVVVSIPDWGASFYGQGSDPGAIAKGIDAFNEANRSAAARGTRYADVTPASRSAAGDESLFAPDGLHPSGAQYSIWVGVISASLF